MDDMSHSECTKLEKETGEVKAPDPPPSTLIKASFPKRYALQEAIHPHELQRHNVP